MQDSSTPGVAAPTGCMADVDLGDRRARWALGIGLLLLLLGMIRLGQYHGFGPRGTDDQYYYAQARSLLMDGDLDLHEELSSLTPRPENINTSTRRAWDEPTETGRVACKYGIGAPLLLLPFLAVGQGLALIFQSFGASTNGYGLFPYLGWSIGNLFYAGLALFLVYRILRTWAGLTPLWSMAAVWAAFLAGPLLYQTISDPFMAHIPSTAMVCVCAAFLFLDRSGSPWSYLGAGLALGLAMAVRQSNFVYAALFLPRLWSDRASLRSLLLPAAAGLLMGFLPQLLAWKYLYGAFVHYSYEGESLSLFSPHLYENLFGARAGLFFWNPGWALALLLYPFRRRETIGLTLATMAIIWLNSAWWCWWWGDTYGGRAYASLFLPVSLGMASILQMGSTSRFWRPIVVLLLLATCVYSANRLRLMETSYPTQRALQAWRPFR